MKTTKHMFWVQMVRATTMIVIGGVALTCLSKVIHPTPRPYYAILAQTAATKIKFDTENKNGVMADVDHVRANSK